MVLRINNIDFSKFCVQGGYNVNRSDSVIDEWTDGNGTTHRSGVTPKVAGSIDMYFRNPADYFSLIENIRNGRLGKPYLRLEVAVNNSADSNLYAGDFFVEILAKRDRNCMGKDSFENITMEIQEC